VKGEVDGEADDLWWRCILAASKPRQFISQITFSISNTKYIQKLSSSFEMTDKGMPITFHPLLYEGFKVSNYILFVVLSFGGSYPSMSQESKIIRIQRFKPQRNICKRLKD